MSASPYEEHDSCKVMLALLTLTGTGLLGSRHSDGEEKIPLSKPGIKIWLSSLQPLLDDQETA
jgi:hypothetical protein